MFEKKAKYLEFVQGIINRMAEDSFKCKEFCILIISAMVAVYASVGNDARLIVVLCGVPILLFWSLDAFFLRQEKGFRELYNKYAVLNGEHDFDDFTIKPNVKGINYFKVFFSKTLLPLYGILLSLSVTLGVLLLTIWAA